jgi:hypothetical protein
MKTQDQIQACLPSSKGLFWRGFLFRLVYGLSGVPLLFLIRPDFFTHEKRFRLIPGTLFYLFICLAGGGHDVSTGQEARFRPFSKHPKRDLILLALIIFSLIYMP